MKNLNKTLSLAAIATIALVGCGGSGESTPAAATASKSVVVKNSDGSTLGVTCGDLVSSGGITGMSLCTVGTTDIVGFIRTDTTVSDKSGAVVGECSPDFDISLLETDAEVNGNCTLSSTSTSSGSSTTSSSGGSSSTSSGSSSSGDTVIGDDDLQPLDGATVGYGESGVDMSGAGAPDHL